MTGLIYEVVLGRLLALHLGSSGASQAVTLATFLGGMAGGAVLAGLAGRRLLPRLKQPLMGYVLLEAAIGLWMLAFVPLADVCFALFSDLAAGRSPELAIVIGGKLLVAAVLVLPLALAMGATLPALAFAAERLDPAHGVQRVSRYYVVNATGAAFGAALAGFVLIDQLGLELPLTLGAAVNLAIAGIAWRAGRGETSPTTTEIAAQTPIATAETAEINQTGGAAKVAGLRTLLFAATTTGFVALLCEIAWTRLNALLIGASVYAFAAMLVAVIAGIALGSGVATRLISNGKSARTVLVQSQLLAAMGTVFLVLRLAQMPLELLNLHVRLAPLPENYALWIALAEGYAMLHLLPSAAALGAAFPALLAAASTAGARTDRATSALLAANTLGNLLGALGGGFILLPLLGLDRTLLLGAVLSVLVALVVVARPMSYRQALVLCVTALICLSFFVVRPGMETLDWGLYRSPPRFLVNIEERIAVNRKGITLFREDSKDATIAVQRYPDGNVLFRTNGKVDGSSGKDAVTQVLLGHVGFVLQPKARDVFIVGLGTGQTAAAVASHPDTRVTVAEMSPAVVEVAKIFAPWNGNVLARANVRVVVADAREALRAFAPASLDLVVSEPSNPWVIGVADLYTIEHFSRLRQHLRPNGVLVQWIHTYEIGDRLLAQILCTFAGLFPHAAVFRLGDGDLALIGSATPLAVDAVEVSKMLEQPDMKKELSTHRGVVLPHTLDDWLVMQLAGESTVHQVCQLGVPLLQERFPRLEYDAPRDFFSDQTANALLAALDTRMTAQGDTWLALSLAKAPLTPERRQKLRYFLQGWSTESELPLLASVSDAESQPPDAAVALGLPDPATLTAARRAEQCAWLRKKTPWLLDHPQTELGPTLGRAESLRWSRLCPRKSR